MRSAEHALRGAAVLAVLFALLGTTSALNLPLPPTPLWLFASLTADKTAVLIIFPPTWSSANGTVANNFTVQRSQDASFSSPTALSNSYLPTPGNTGLMAVDTPWTGARPYYRVIGADSAGNVVGTSQPLQPFDQAGNVVVVNGANVTAGVTCGDLVSAPCPDIRSALAVAPAGSTIYVTPGVYHGPGNTNLTFAGKAVTIQSTSGSAVTAINCTDPATGVATRAFSFTSGETRASVIAGLTLTFGAADAGGCISITNGSPTIRDSFFFECNALTGAAAGGAIYASGNPAPGPLIQNSSFILNYAGFGAGIYVDGKSRLTVDGSFFQWGICPTSTGQGGAIYAVNANVTVTNSRAENGITGFGGGAIMAVQSSVVLDRFTAYNNSAGNFGGGLHLFGSDMRVTRSNLTANVGKVYAGAIQITSSTFEANDTIFNNNHGRVGGGAIKLMSGTVRVRRCQLNGNTASYGGGFDIFIANDLSTLFTELLVEDSEVRDNVVVDRGAAFALDTFDAATFRNVTFANNTAARGGAGYSNAPLSSRTGATPAILSNVTFERNVAQFGGGFFAEGPPGSQGPCIVHIERTVFRHNTAVDSGAGLATSNGVALNITGSLFEANGVSDCPSTKPPTAGGAVMIGVEEFNVNQQCGAATLQLLTNVTISNSTFVGNVAMAKGGAVHVEAGTLAMDGVELDSNSAMAVPGSPASGLGGGLSVVERCAAAASSCSTAAAQLARCQLRGNSAGLAGGALHFAGNSSGGALSLVDSVVEGNSVVYTTSGSADGVGGGIFVGRPGFSLSGVQLTRNQAYYGGGLFVAADLRASGGALRGLNASGNTAVEGADAFWLRSASPQSPLDASAFVALSAPAGSIATEVLNISYSQVPPAVIQSGEDMPPFSVDMLDFYGNVGQSEAGTCVVTPAAGDAAAGAARGNATVITIRPLGSEVAVSRGAAAFSQVEANGLIGLNYALQVNCTPNSLGRTRFLELSGAALPPLPLPVHISQCLPGREPVNASAGSVCALCSYNSFDLDGQRCLPCPAGAVCGGGAQLDAKENFWRSSYQATELFSCVRPNVCKAGPVAGNDACPVGAEGPLCAVCSPDYFDFGGKCQSCKRGGLANLMLAFSVIGIIVVVVLLFVRNWDFGDPSKPGIMTKLKIVLAHFQVLALFKEYDVIWPEVTSRSLAWFDAFNVGLSMMAPACSLGRSYTFWWKWVAEMLMPVGAVALCVGLYFLSDWYLRRHINAAAAAATEAEGEGEGEGGARSGPVPAPAGPAASHGRLAAWLAGLKIRCWKNAFWFVTLLYPRSSSTALQMFGLKRLDTGTYLAADFGIMVRPPHGELTDTYVRYLVPGVIMLLVFAVIIPAVFFYIIWRNRGRLDEHEVAVKYGFLYSAYTRKLAYWETFESMRKFLYALIPVLVKPNTVGSVQGTVGQIVAGGSLVATVWLRPYANPEDNDLAIFSMSALWLILLSACTSKWAGLSNSGLVGLGTAQLVLTLSVAALIIGWILYSAVQLVRRGGAERLDSNVGEGALTDDAEAAERKRASGASFSVSIRAGPAEKPGAALRDSVSSGADTDTPTSARKPLLGSVFSRFRRTTSGQVPLNQGTATSAEEAAAVGAAGEGGVETPRGGGATA